MTDEERALRDAFLAELWPTCHEVPREDRAVERERQKAEQRAVEEMAAQAVDDAGGKPIWGAA